MDKTIIIIILCLCSFICMSLIILGGGGGGYYYIKYNSKSEEPELVPKKIICKVKKDPDSITCSNLDNNTNFINITSSPLVKISYTDEKNKSGTSSTRHYYITIPYKFVVDYAIMLSKGDIKINSLDDLYNLFLKAKQDSDESLKDLDDKCLNVSLDIRSKGLPPHNTLCTFINDGFNNIEASTNLFTDILLKFVPENVKNQYYNILLKKIKDTSTLNILEYIMYISIYKLKNQNKYTYIPQCESVRTISC